MGQYRQSFHPRPAEREAVGLRGRHERAPEVELPGRVDIVATRGTPVRVNFINRLPAIHPLPIDNTLPGAERARTSTRAVAHLHGGFIVWPSRRRPLSLVGTPRWGSTVRPGSGGCRPPRNPDGRRLLVQRADGSAHVVSRPRPRRHPAQRLRRTRLGLPPARRVELRLFGSGGEVQGQTPRDPLVLQDRGSKSVADHGDPREASTTRAACGPQVYPAPPLATGFRARGPCVPEMFGTSPVINGMAYPELTLPAGVHRFRMLNATQSRVWNLQLYRESAADPGDANLDAKGPDFMRSAPRGAFCRSRWSCRRGTRSTSPSTPARDRGATAWCSPGRSEPTCSSTSSRLSQGRASSCYNDAPLALPGRQRGRLPHGQRRRAGQHPRPQHPHPDAHPDHERRRRPEGDGRPPARRRHHGAGHGTPARALLPSTTPPSGRCSKHPDFYTRRTRTLNEGWDPYGRLVQILGTGFPSRKDGTVYGMHYTDGLSEEEVHLSGRPEVWDIYNTTGDTHPIHFHLVNVQILGRAPSLRTRTGTRWTEPSHRAAPSSRPTPTSSASGRRCE